MINFRSITDLDRAIARNLWKLDRSSFDVVVGIPRSGIAPAGIISTYLQKPFATLEGLIAGQVHGRSGHLATARARRILLVDDTSNKGGAMARAVGQLRQFDRKLEITRCAVFGPYQVEDPAAIIDVWFEDCIGPRGFAWNMWKHTRARKWAFDFDGVLCRDPSKAENDDGERYREFLLTAPPLFLPQREIGHIITSRLEKWRPETEAWLGRLGVEYQQLHMLDLPDKAARMHAMRSGGRGGWKAGIARAVGVELMVESCHKQARIIAREAGIPVFCTELMQTFEPGEA
jgi:uncharacterized HAD superfamily protein